MNVNKALKEFNAHLRNEVHELKNVVHELKNVISMLLESNQELEDKLKKEKKRSQNYFDDMIRAECECDRLNESVEKLQAENATLKSQNGSIFTDPEKFRKLKQEGTEHDNT